MERSGILPPDKIASLLAAESEREQYKRKTIGGNRVYEIDPLTLKIKYTETIYTDISTEDEEESPTFITRKKHKIKYAVCLTCGKQFHLKRSNQKYCKPECRDNYERASRLQEMIDQGVRKCGYCGNNLPDWKKLHARYCDDNCKMEAYKLRHDS